MPASRPEPAAVLAEHPAVSAWRQLSRIRPTSLESLTTGSRNGGGKSSVYRLEGVGAGGVPVIAKRGHRRGLAVERRIYEDVLPSMPVTGLRYYGFVEDGDRSWLFLEEAPGIPYDKVSPDHRAMGARWLAGLHTASSHLGLGGVLPDHGPDRYLSYVHAARQRITDGLSDPAVPDGRDVLRGLLTQLDELEASWIHLEEACSVSSPCVVHGDFNAKNVRIAGAAVYVMDWETAGWGSTAPDIQAIDLATYRSLVTDTWPNLPLRALQTAARAGTVFRYIAAIHWASHAFTPRALLDLRIHADWLARARQALNGDRR